MVSERSRPLFVGVRLLHKVLSPQSFSRLWDIDLKRAYWKRTVSVANHIATSLIQIENGRIASKRVRLEVIWDTTIITENEQRPPRRLIALVRRRLSFISRVGVYEIGLSVLAMSFGGDKPSPDINRHEEGCKVVVKGCQLFGHERPIIFGN